MPSVGPGICRMTRPGGTNTSYKVNVCPNVPPAACEAGQTIRVTPLSVTCARVKPIWIVVYHRTIVMNRVNQLVVNGRSKGDSGASGVQHNGRAGSRAIPVNAYQITAPVGKLIRTGGMRPSVYWERLDTLDEDQRIIPSVIQRVAQYCVGAAFSGEAPVVT